MDRAELKRLAREQLGGKIFGNVWLYAVVVMLVYAVLLGIGNWNTWLGAAVSLLILGPVACSIAKMFLKQSEDHQAMQLKDLAFGFQEDFSGNFLLNLMETIFIALWCLLLVVPGIIKAISWSMAYYIKVEHPDYGWKQCMDASAALTNGHKGEIFVLELSFIGWYIVGALCLGVGDLWVRAYNEATRAQCYKWLKTQQVEQV